MLPAWQRLKAGEEGDDRGWDGWMASLIQWTWIWANSEGQRSLGYCSPCGHKESDRTEWLNNNSAPFGYDSCPFKEPRHVQYCWLIYQTHWVKRWEFWLWPGLHHVFWSLFHRMYLSVSTCVGKHPVGIFTQSYLENTDVSSSEWTLHGHSLWRWRIVKGTG